MSCFIVKDESIGMLASCFEAWHFGGDCYKQSVVRPLDFYNVSYDNGDDHAFEKLAQAMFELNCEAYKSRYPKESVEMDGFKLIPVSALNLNDYQIYKSLQCFLYQCLEGNTHEKPLYKTLVKVFDNLGRYIIEKQEEYKKAEWD